MRYEGKHLPSWVRLGRGGRRPEAPYVPLSPSLIELFQTTLRNRTERLADNVTRNSALLSRLRARTGAEPEPEYVAVHWPAWKNI
jgi:hypothetical protein